MENLKQVFALLRDPSEKGSERSSSIGKLAVIDNIFPSEN